VLKKWSKFGFWYSDKTASSLEEFRSTIKAIGLDSIEHHAKHNDLSKYIREFYNSKTAARVEKAEKELKGEPLRDKILEILK